MTKREDQLEEHSEEASDFLIPPPILKPLIFEGACQDAIPEGFDTLTIRLDGSLRSDLNWERARKEASEAIERGYGIFWDLELGLFSKLTQPLTNRGQFLSLALSLDHFRDTLWKDHQEKTVGVSLFRGALDYSHGFSWDLHQEQSLNSWLSKKCSHRGTDFVQARQTMEGKQLIRLFCRDVAVEYLSLLAARLPDTLTTYLFLDASSFAGSLTDEMQYMNPERFDRFHLAVRNPRLPIESLGWGAPTPSGYSGIVPNILPGSIPSKIGICVPPMDFDPKNHYEGFEEALVELRRLALPFKLIAEDRLTSQWDGLDEVLYSPNGLSTQGRRKLQGFCAAGGTAVSIGELTGFSEEMRLHDWLAKL